MSAPAAGNQLTAERRRLLALMLEKKGLGAASLEKIPRRTVRGPCPASYAQERQWSLAHSKNAGAMQQMHALRLRGTLDPAILQATLDAILARHEALRTVFTTEAGRLLQVVQPEAHIVLPVKDLGSIAGEDRAEAIRREVVEEEDTPFDLRTGPLLRGRLVRVAPDEHLLLLTIHLIAYDGWSRGVLVREIATLYSAFHAGRPSPLPPLDIRYTDYALWQREWLTNEVLRPGLEYWNKQLAGAPPLLQLPTDRPRPAEQCFAGGDLPLTFSTELSLAIKAFARTHDLTLFMLLYAGWGILMARLSGQNDVVVATPMANRPRTELEALIGAFVNYVPLRVRLRDDLTVQELLAQVKEVSIGAFDHQWVPFGKILEAVQPPLNPAYRPIFQVSLMLANTPQGTVTIPGIQLGLQETVIRWAEFEMALSLKEREEHIDARIVYAAALFDHSTIRRWFDHFMQILSWLVTGDTGRTLGQLPHTG